jgi:hypothetical protein
MTADFDEASYLAANPDVSAAVERGDVISGSYHFEVAGRAEAVSFGRSRRAMCSTLTFSRIAICDAPPVLSATNLARSVTGRAVS